MSATGMPSVMQTTSGTPASAASMIASAAAAGGTKMSAESAPASRTASATVFHTGKPSWIVPPLPGRHAADDLGPVLLAAERVERALAAGDPLDDHARRPVDQDAHGVRL